MGIKEARKSRKMTQKQLADAIGVDYSVISKYEKGSVTPPGPRLIAISKVLNYPVDFLINDNILLETHYVRNSDNSGIEEHSIHESVNEDLQFSVQQEFRMQMILKANGICEFCRQPAPFVDSDGLPYLEIHLIKRVMDGGLAIPENTVLLCPNCHTRIHVRKDPHDLQILKKIAESHK